MSERARSPRSPRTRPSNSSAATPGRRTRSAVDVGELVGIEPLGVTATNDVDALLALKPDCVVYNPMWIDVDELVRILSAGVNVVAVRVVHHRRTTWATAATSIAEACKQGGSTMFGSGVSPGFAELLAIVAGTALRPGRQGDHRRVRRHHVLRLTRHRAPVGFGMPIDDPDLQPMAAKGTAVFAEAVQLVADSLGVELDEIACDAEYAQTTEDLAMASWTIKAGHVAGVFASWQGIVGGKTVIDINVRWRRARRWSPDWQARRRRLEDHHRRAGRRSTCRSASCRRRT